MRTRLLQNTCRDCPVLRACSLWAHSEVEVPLARPSLSRASGRAFSTSQNCPLSSTKVELSGSNKWSKIRHKKAVMDMARGNEFGRLTSDIVAAIRAAGPSPDANARLAVLLKKAKEVSFPKDRLDATFAKAQGGSDAIHTATYEALGAEGVAFIIECATDSPARTHAKVKELFNRGISAGSKLSSVGHLFGRRGVIRLSASKEKFDDIFKAALDAGAEDIRDVSEDVESEREANQLTEGQGNIAIIEILSEPANIQKISQALAATDHELLEAEQRTLPTRPPLRIRGLVAEGKPETVPEDEQYGGWVSKETIGKLDKFIEALKESADCHKVWSNVKSWP